MPRQRWRVVFARGDAAAQLAHAEALKHWESALLDAAIPLAFSLGQSPRSRLSFAAPLPIGMLAAGELADLVLTERLTMPELRTRLSACLPAGYCLVDLFDVWLGDPTAASTLVAADYRVALRGASNDELAEACAALLGAAKLPLVRAKGGGGAGVQFDLRPQLLGLEVARDVPIDPNMVGMRLQLTRDAAAARPEDVVQALAHAIGHPVDTAATIRQRLWTASDDLPPFDAQQGSPYTPHSRPDGRPRQPVP